MSTETSKEDLFLLIWLGTESESVPERKFTNQFTSFVQFNEWILLQKKSSVVLILSKGVSLDQNLTDLSQICAIYNEALVCLHCNCTMVLFLYVYMKNHQQKELKKGPVRSCLTYVWAMIRKFWFLIGLGFVIGMAYAWPDLGKTGGHIRSEWSVKWGCVIVIFFLSGLSLRTKLLVKEFLRIRVHIIIQLYSLLIFPFTVYGLALLLARLPINKTLITGIVIMACTSTTISSNVVMTKNALGNEYAALLNAALGNFLGIFISPALISYFMKNPVVNSLSSSNSDSGGLDYGSVMKNLGLTVLVPLFVGQVIQLIWTKQVAYIREKFYLSEVNSLALLALVWSVFCTAVATGSFQLVDGSSLGALFVIDSGLYILFSLLIMLTARIPIRHWQLSRKDAVAMMYCGATKTVAMGIPLINVLYAGGDSEVIGLLSLPLIIYHVLQLILGAVEVQLLKIWVNREEQKQTVTSENNTDVQPTNVVAPEAPELREISVR